MELTTPVLPRPDATTEFYWRAAAEHRLEILRCRSCGHYIHWPRPVCSACTSRDLRPAQVSGRGRLVSWCTVVQPFHPWFADKVPYILGLVELAEEPGLKLVTTIVGHAGHELDIGRALTVDFAPLSREFTLPVFRPAGPADDAAR
jgi:uncharacterized OB-fold protein